MNKNKAFTLIEILIVVSILGILAAITIPEFYGHTQKAKEAAAKENLQILRTTIQRYAMNHNDTPPGYPSGDDSAAADSSWFIGQIVLYSDSQGLIRSSKDTNFPYGPYIKEIPKNPFNNINTIIIAESSDDIANKITGEGGWVYHAGTRAIRVDWTGNDSQGTAFIDY